MDYANEENQADTSYQKVNSANLKHVFPNYTKQSVTGTLKYTY